MTTANRVDWDEALRNLDRLYPHLRDLDWVEAFADVDVLGKLIHDILRVEPSSKKRGPRKHIRADDVDGAALLRQLAGDDYTVRPFADAVNVLMRATLTSERALANRSTLSRAHLQRVLRGQLPTMDDIEAIAKVFRKRPDYFLEYRVAAIGAAIMDRLTSNPDYTVSLMDKLRRGAR